jgi:hypothetical protein
MSSSRSSSDTSPLSFAKQKGRKRGVPNYRNECLLNAIDEIKPTSSKGWSRVALLYKQDSGEDFLRDEDDIKTHFYRKLCNNFQKPTGRSSPSPLASRALNIAKSIELNRHAHVFGFSSKKGEKEEEDEADDEDDDEEEGEDEAEAEEEKVNQTTNEPTQRDEPNQREDEEEKDEEATFLHLPYSNSGSSLGKRTVDKTSSSSSSDTKSKNSRHNPRTSFAGNMTKALDNVGNGSFQQTMVNMMSLFMQRDKQEANERRHEERMQQMMMFHQQQQQQFQQQQQQQQRQYEQQQQQFMLLLGALFRNNNNNNSDNINSNV